MITSKKTRYGIIIFYMVLIFIASSIHNVKIPEAKIIGIDKLLHMTEYAIFGSILAFALLPYREKLIKAAHYLTVIGIGWGYAVTDEIHQYFVPNRDMSIYDFFADAIGVLIGLGLYLLFMRFIYPKLKRSR